MNRDPSRHTAAGRIAPIDAVRGFALLGILIVHMVEQYLGSPPPPSEPDLGIFTVADQITRVAVLVLFVGKFFALFSLLFGVSFFIQLDRAAARGEPFAGRFAWRLAILFAIGMVHHLLYRGDILAIYAVLGLCLLPLQRLSDRALLVVAAVLALGAHRVALGAWAAAVGQPIIVMAVDEPALEAYVAALRSGSMSALMASNLTDGLLTKLQFQFGWMGRGWQTLALFVIGVYIGRRRWHERLPELRRPIRWLTVSGLAVSLACAGVLAAAFASGLIPQSADAARWWHYVVGLGLYDLFNLGVMTLFGGSFVLLATGRLRQVLRHFAPVGQTALTTYMTQSLAGAFIFYGFGLGLLGRMPLTLAFLLAFAIFAVQMIASTLWLRAFRHGPLEWAWRSLTDRRLRPATRTSSPGAAF